MSFEIMVLNDATFYRERARHHGTMVDYYAKGFLGAPEKPRALKDHYCEQLIVEARTAFHFARLLSEAQVAEEREYQAEFTRDHWAV